MESSSKILSSWKVINSLFKLLKGQKGLTLYLTLVTRFTTLFLDVLYAEIFSGIVHAGVRLITAKLL